MSMIQKSPNNSLLANIGEHLLVIQEKNSESEEINSTEIDAISLKISQSITSRDEPTLVGKNVD